jgi:putative ABC transport system ATP-binding protein
MDLATMENVMKTYKVGDVPIQALGGINLSVPSGIFVSFIGPSGSGKTTLLNLLGCLDKPSFGTITIAGTETGKLDRRAAAKFRGEHIGFIFQNFNLLPVLTVFENVEYPLVMVKKIPREIREQKIMKLLEDVGMADQRNKYPSQLSGGQKQRVAVARAMVADPRIVLADEPTANLDHDTAYKVIKLMHDMKNEFNTTFIFATHDPRVVGEAEIVYTIEDGLIVDGRNTLGATGDERK